MPYTADDRRFLYTLLVNRFNPNELYTLVWMELDIDPEVISKSTQHDAFCRELLRERERSGQVYSLVQAILDQRAARPFPPSEQQTLLRLLARLRDEAEAPPQEPPDAEPNDLRTQMLAQERQAREAAEAQAREEARQRQQLAQALAQERQAREAAEAQAREEARQRQKLAQQLEEARSKPPPAPASPQADGPTPDIPRLSAWNPRDHLRLLCWLFLAPTRLAAHRRAFGLEAERGVGYWLASTLTWLPLFIPSLALGLEQLPRVSGAWTPDSYLWISAGLLLAWLLTDVLGVIDPPSLKDGAVGVAVGVAGVVAVGVAFGVAFGVAGVVAGGVAGGVAFSVASGVAFGVASGVAGVVAGGVERAVEQGAATWLTRALFVLLLLSHAFLLWFSFLGGWRLFGAA